MWAPYIHQTKGSEWELTSLGPCAQYSAHLIECSLLLCELSVIAPFHRWENISSVRWMCQRSLASTSAELRQSNLSPSKMGKHGNISHENPETLHSETKKKKKKWSCWKANDKIGELCFRKSLWNPNLLNRYSRDGSSHCGVTLASKIFEYT